MNRFVIDGARLGTAAMMAAVLSLPAGSAHAQPQGPNDWCRGERGGYDRASTCDVREFTVAATGGTLAVEGTNGGISVEGEARSDVRILAKVVATARSDQRARQIAAAVRLAPTLDRVHADGPGNLQNGEGWSVSYRLSVPRGLNLALHTTNGGISIRDVESSVQFRTTNGGVKLAGIGGDVKGQTTNGGVDVELEGHSWIGEGLDVETTNGGVKIAIPAQYSARFQASTNNGGFHVDHPGAVQGRRDRQARDIDVQLGAGGAPIKVRTSNGGVRVVEK